MGWFTLLDVGMYTPYSNPVTMYIVHIYYLEKVNFISNNEVVDLKDFYLLCIWQVYDSGWRDIGE